VQPAAIAGASFPRGHHQRIVPGMICPATPTGSRRVKLSAFAARIDVAQNRIVRETGVIFEAGCGIGDVVLGFYNGLAGITAFQFGKLRGVRPNFLRQIVKKAAPLIGARLPPRAGIKRGACLLSRRYRHRPPCPRRPARSLLQWKDRTRETSRRKSS